MPIIRTFFYLLLAANLLLALITGLHMTGYQVPWHSSGENERLSRQLAAEKILIRTDASPAAKPLAADPAPIASPTALPAPLGDNPTCLALKGLSAEDVQQITHLSGQLGEVVKLRSSGVLPTSYWVNIPPGGGKEGALRRGEILTKAGITDYIIVREAGPHQFAISLGLFRNDNAAQRLIEQLKKKNIQTARVTVRDNTNANARIELRGPNATISPFLAQVLPGLKTAQRDDCLPE